MNTTRDEEYFSKMVKPFQFVEYMNDVVKNKRASPIYRFDTPDSLMEYDNYW